MMPMLFRRIQSPIYSSVFSFLAILALSQVVPVRGSRIPYGSRALSAAAESAGAKPPAIVVGFVGGFIRHDNIVHSEVQLAARLRKSYATGVDVETFESYHGDSAVKKILSLLDTNHDGTLTAAEKQ